MKKIATSIFNLMFSNGLYKAGGAFLLVIICTLLAGIDGMEWMDIVALVPIYYITLVILVFIVFAWIINPLKDLKKKRTENGK